MQAVWLVNPVEALPPPSPTKLAGREGLQLDALQPSSSLLSSLFSSSFHTLAISTVPLLSFTFACEELPTSRDCKWT